MFDGRLAFGAAVRYDDNDLFAARPTCVARSATVRVGYRAWGAAGTGAKNPTFFELFGFDPDFFIGNPDLEPEQSTGWEVGLERSFNDRGFIAWPGSTAREDELFTASSPGFVSSPQNRVSDRRNGAWIFRQRAHRRTVRIDASYTWLYADEDGFDEIPVPPHRV